MMPLKKHVDDIKRYIINDIDRSDYLRLDKNEFSVPFSDKILDSFKKHISSYSIQAYPSTFDLNRRLATLLDYPYEDHILMTAGSDYGLKACYDAFVEKEDTVGLPCPTYAMNDVFLRSSGCKTELFQYGKDLKLPYKHILEKIPDLKMLVLAYPNQPTGKIDDEDAILSIIKKAREFCVWTIIDEAYFSFSKKTFADQIKHFENLIVIRSFSKSYGLAGMRIGAILAQPKIISYINKVMPVYSVSSLSQDFLLSVIEHREDFEALVKEQIETLKNLSDFYTSLGCYCYPSDTNFIMIEESEKLACESYINFLKNHRILIRGPFTSYPFKKAFRITSTDQKGFERLKEATLLYLKQSAEK